jgi:hypothetical protein
MIYRMIEYHAMLLRKYEMRIVQLVMRIKSWILDNIYCKML